MTAPRGVVVLAAALGGGLLGVVAGFVAALAFSQALFGWHDNIGPELGLAVLGGLIGAAVGGAWAASRRKESTHE